jgi:hypothetical protein
MDPAIRLIIALSFWINYSFTAPAVRPLIIYRWNINTKATGNITAKTAEAVIFPY